MSPTIYGCLICGLEIYYGDAQASWQNEYRGICTDDTGVFLTGVGLYDPQGEVYGFVAPRDPEGRWDDVGYASPQEDCFGAMTLNPVDGRFGFIFHNACWLLLQKAAFPESIPLVRWYEVCASLPIPLRHPTISWGHTYGGYTMMDNETSYPWEDRVEYEEHSEDMEAEMSAEPYLNRHAEYLAADASKQPFTSVSSSPTTASREVDCLGSLPLEIRIRIAIHLSTRDMLATRLASKPFWSILDSQQFWASRFFELEAERSWLFEAREQKAPLNWRWLYRKTAHLHSNLGLRNRKRIWDLLRQVLPILNLNRTEQSPIQAMKSKKLDMQNYCWTEAMANVHLGRKVGRGFVFHEGCLVFNRQHAYLEESVVKVSASFVRIGDMQYITGLEFIASKGDSLRLGYWNLMQPSQRQSVQVQCLNGFNLAVGARGIHALQCILTDGAVSPWLGSPVGAPQTRRLASWNPFIGVEAGLDGFKIVTLSTGERRTSNTTKSLRINLSAMALWYPQLPPSSLCMNDDSFLPRHTYIKGYRPLLWATFGGPSGIYLKHLTQINIYFSGTIHAIEFSHEIDVPAEHQILGRNITYDEDMRIEFPIDGPGGELMERVQLFQYQDISDDSCRPKGGGRVSGQITTNRGRRCRFGDCLNNDPLMEISVASGSTITGFYTSDRYLDEGRGFVALGVISEVVEPI